MAMPLITYLAIDVPEIKSENKIVIIYFFYEQQFILIAEM